MACKCWNFAATSSFGGLTLGQSRELALKREQHPELQARLRLHPIQSQSLVVLQARRTTLAVQRRTYY
jgi:hypothetical protein